MTNPKYVQCNAASTPTMDTSRWFLSQSRDRVSIPTSENEVEPLVDGAAALAKIKETMQGAKQRIFIAGWAISPDLYLTRAGGTGETLVDVLAGKSDVEIRILLWDSLGPVDSLDEDVEKRLEAAGRHIRVLRHRAALSSSHHQKFVVVDDDKALLGGVDMFQGRWDDGGHPITPMKAPHQKNLTTRTVLNGVDDYDPYGPELEEALADDKNPKKDVSMLPRMPWHDVHVFIKGPAALCVAYNFIERWNHHAKEHAVYGFKIQHTAGKIADREGDDNKESLKDAKALLEEGLAHGFGIDGETQFSEDKWRLPNPSSGSPASVQIVRTMLKNSGHEQVTSIYDAYRTAIRGACHYIYIENQFFISKNPKYPTIENTIANDIIEQVGQWTCHPEEPNHVYIVVPLHPEGILKPMVQIPERVANAVTFIVEKAQAIKELAEFAKKVYDDVSLKRLAESVVDTVKEYVEEIWAKIYGEVAVKVDALVGPWIDELKERAAKLKKDATDWFEQTHVGKYFMDASASAKSALWGQLKASAEKTLQLAAKVQEWAASMLDRLFSSTHGSTVAQIETLRYLYNEIGKRAIAANKTADDYLSVFYLRNWGRIAGRCVTEQIYVHSKVMIVDDIVTIIGSANIFDRSLMGERDSEIAAIILDRECETKVGGFSRKGRKAACELRKTLWREHFLTKEEDPALIADPLGSAGALTHMLMKDRAKANQRLYKAAFGDNFPSNSQKTITTHGLLTAPPAAESTLNQVCAHAVEYPLQWLLNENMTLPENLLKKEFTQKLDREGPMVG